MSLQTHLRGAALTLLTCVLVTPVHAQEGRTGWGSEVSGLLAYRGPADLDGGGDVAVTRSFLRLGGLYRFDNGVGAGFGLGLGRLSYDFGGPTTAPWGDVNTLRLSAPLQFTVGESTEVIVAPQLRWDYETDADTEGFTYGVFAGASWQVTSNLRIGPAFGVFSELEGSDVTGFPAVLVDWDIAPRWNLSTGGGVGATQGPGLALRYDHTDSLSFGLAVRSEDARFRLDNSGVAPNGIGEDSGIPVVLSMGYNPNPGVSFNAFVGAEFDGELRIEDANGNFVSKQGYDTAPLAGLSLRLRF